MRKVLLILLIVLLLFFGITTATKGFQVGEFRICSIQEIGENSQTLDAKLQEVNTLIDSQYPAAREKLSSASKKELSAKEQYLSEINETTEEELTEILQVKNFDIERIWAVVGNHAINEGVNITLNETKESTTGARNLHFTVKGTYLAQTNFLYAIEDDPELNYRIYNYKLVPSTEANDLSLNILNATFAIKETIITKSLNDALNGYETEDQKVLDSIFDNPEQAINGKKEPYDSIPTIPPSTQSNGGGTTSTPTPTPTPTPITTPSGTPTPTPKPT